MKKYYIVYKYNKNNNDIENVTEFTERNEVANWLQIRIDNLAKYVCKNIENINCKLKEDKYFIVIDKEA